jgi:DNA invertase Pin-like site-specific DNA recombinase
MERIAAVGAGFRSLTESIDTTSPAGRMMMQIVASFAEFERTMIRERTSAGLTAFRGTRPELRGRTTGCRTPSGKFILMTRLCEHGPSILNGSWKIPAVIRVC